MASGRKRNILLCISSLVLGWLIYILFRENSQIGVLFGSAYVQGLRKAVAWLSCDFLQFYFPDFLWGFSLCSGLLAIYDPGLKGCIVCGCTAALCGYAWEWMQYINIVSGTGDIYDILMYSLAGFMCIIINLRRERNEKN